MQKVTGINCNDGLERYTIENEIGRGASGICYRAKCKNDDKIYAIKKILLNNLKVCLLTTILEAKPEGSHERSKCTKKSESPQHHKISRIIHR